jgi:hypothetical protein
MERNKNIHVLATPNPSRLYLTKEGFYFLLPNIKGNNVKFQNIYITNDEEIKEGDWIIDLVRNNISEVSGISNEDNNIVLDSGSFANINQCKKIILTTDQDLIKDGVQAIDDEFLEWFVKNPSCEEVEVYKDKRLEIEQDFEFYEIIIPKEEPKLTNVCIKCGVDLYYADNFACQEHPKNCKGIHLSEETLREWASKEEPKQETENLKNFKKLVSDEISPAMKDFIKEKQETLEEAKKQQFKYDNLHDAKEISSRIKVIETLEEAAERTLGIFYGYSFLKDTVKQLKEKRMGLKISLNKMSNDLYGNRYYVNYLSKVEKGEIPNVSFEVIARMTIYLEQFKKK